MATLQLKVLKGRMTVGRDPANDHRIDHPLVSKHHAVLVQSPGGWTIEDLGSQNGTFVNGERIAAPRAITASDTIQIGPVRLRLGDDGVESDDLRLSTRVEVQGVTLDLQKGGRAIRLLRGLSFTIEPGEFVALMGPAGAGKTTLMECMNGNMTPTEGRVLVNGLDLHRSYDAMRGHIGYVPQDDIVHRKLTVYEACYYTAKMRMPGLSEQELHDRVVKVLVELDIAHRANTIIGGPEARVLSGGQRKRVNLAMELVTDPAILFLDEPTSGLSSADAKSVMQVLKGLSEKGRTIILTIHQPSREVFEMMDHALILGVGGRLVYYGPVTESYGRFGSGPNPDALFEKLSPKLVEADWVRMEEEFRGTRWFQKYVVDRAAVGDSGARQPRARVSRAFGLGQFALLFERLTKLYTRDVGWLVGAVLGAPALMMLLASLTSEPSKRHTLLFIAVLLAFFFGIFPAIEMINSEKAIYERERMVNLKIPSYILSKMLFLAAFGMFQAFSLAAIICWFAEADGPFAPIFVTVLSVQLAGVTSGLFFSTVAKSSKTALLYMLAWLVLMIAFSGFVVRLPDLRDSGSEWILGPSSMRWGMGALMDLVSDVKEMHRNALGFTAEAWQLNVIVNFLLSLLPLVGTMLVLRVRDRV